MVAIRVPERALHAGVEAAVVAGIEAHEGFPVVRQVVVVIIVRVIDERRERGERDRLPGSSGRLNRHGHMVAAGIFLVEHFHIIRHVCRQPDPFGALRGELVILGGPGGGRPEKEGLAAYGRDEPLAELAVGRVLGGIGSGRVGTAVQIEGAAVVPRDPECVPAFGLGGETPAKPLAVVIRPRGGLPGRERVPHGRVFEESRGADEVGDAASRQIPPGVALEGARRAVWSVWRAGTRQGVIDEFDEIGDAVGIRIPVFSLGLDRRPVVGGVERVLDLPCVRKAVAIRVGGIGDSRAQGGGGHHLAGGLGNPLEGLHLGQAHEAVAHQIVAEELDPDLPGGDRGGEIPGHGTVHILPGSGVEILPGDFRSGRVEDGDAEV